MTKHFKLTQVLLKHISHHSPVGLHLLNLICIKSGIYPRIWQIPLKFLVFIVD